MNLKKTILLANVVLTILILWVLVSIVYTWASNIGSKSTIKETELKLDHPKTALAIVKNDLKDFELIIKKDIFSTLKDTSGAASLKRDSTDARETSLNLKLRGTAVGENNISYAIIFDGSTGKEDIYELNATIQDARIQEILSDKIILNINGREEALLLPVESTRVPRRSYHRPSTRAPSPRKINRPKKTVSLPKKTITPPVMPGQKNPE